MRLYSWNVNGIRAAQKKGFLEWLDQTAPDVRGGGDGARGHVRDDGDGGVADLDVRKELLELALGVLHQRAVERSGHVQLHGLLGAPTGSELDGAIDAVHRARHDHLSDPGAVEVEPGRGQAVEAGVTDAGQLEDQRAGVEIRRLDTAGSLKKSSGG